MPQTPAQRAALNSPADIVLFGGSAGSLKSETLLMDAVAEFRNPNLRGVIFRESYPNLTDLIRKAYRLYKRYPYYGNYNKTDKTWSFPSNAAEVADPSNAERVASGELKPNYIDGQGGQIMFRYLDADDDVEDHQGQEYSFIGFDESTHQTEYRIRYLLSRLRSTDNTLRLRMRLATNPGGEGHVFHMKVFLGDACPHCEPGKGREPFKIYSDACWSDGTPLSSRDEITGETVTYTTQFIPGRVTDHNLFGAGNVKYKAQLRMQKPATADALLAGCWRQFEGQYFTCWDDTRGSTIDEFGRIVVSVPDMRMVVPRQEVQEQYWWTHFIGADYGFSISAAATHLFVRSPKDEWFPNGRIYVIGEIMRRGMVAQDFAGEMLKNWFLDARGQVPEVPRSIQMWALSPDAWIRSGQAGDQGVALSRADQMNAVVGQYGFNFIKASDDRAGGWMHMWRMLRSGELVICDNCPTLIEAIPSRIHDPKKSDDILKRPGDERDDCVDSARYGLYSWQQVATKPIEIEIAERMQGLDPTNAMMTRLKILSETSAENAPVFTSPSAQRRYQQRNRRSY